MLTKWKNEFHDWKHLGIWVQQRHTNQFYSACDEKQPPIGHHYVQVLQHKTNNMNGYQVDGLVVRENRHTRHLQQRDRPMLKNKVYDEKST